MSTTDTSSYYSDTDTENSEDNNLEWSGKLIKNKYIILNKIGSGSYCSVWNTYNIDDQKLYALKIYKNDEEDDNDHANLEVNIMNTIRQFNMSNCVLFTENFNYEYRDEESDYDGVIFLMQITELCGYSLYEINKLFREIFPDNKVLYAKYIDFIYRANKIILTIIDTMHKHNFSHTDIKPENILIDIPKLDSMILYNKIKQVHNDLKSALKKKGKLKNLNEILTKESKNIVDKIELSDLDIIEYLKEFKFSIKLCDFGTSLTIPDKTIYKKHTTYYKSPKIILKYELDKTYDYWAYGCTLYELITSKILFDPFNELVVDQYGDYENHNLLYLITCSLGMPSMDFINKSNVADLYFTTDRTCMRGYTDINYNPFISNMTKFIDLLKNGDNNGDNYDFTDSIDKLNKLIMLVCKYVNYNFIEN
jgi:serine/threonine protein kinase